MIKKNGDLNNVVLRRGVDGRIPDHSLGRGASTSAAEAASYPGGPYNTSLLVKYELHVAHHLWFGEERGLKKELKVVGHELKLTSRVPLALPQQMESWISRSESSLLQRTSLNKIDTNLAFATRAYLLMLVDSTIFADKTFTLVETRYLLLFTDLDRCSGYSWGATALVSYTDTLEMRPCSVASSLVDILLSYRGENWKPDDNYGLPRAMKWSYRQGVLKVDDLLSILEELILADVIWPPFEDHRGWRQFDELCLYMGCLKWGDTVVPYLLDRCIRQFGYKQYVPSPPHDCMMANDIDVDWIGYHQSVLAVIRPTTLATTPSDIKDGYLE
ncbi:protein MAINTENANCE OF MERISTEMS-like [Lathyrus oleraceus]|uniref:protein MAINTENANCE OF MERISTEMS-like n=1 Tax=Pisum sativum TaxID=3888 RepID=UPI0021D3D7ED|nr:protein MAINTENANCE OF MERISTEMS-like [Pisum sativum]